MSMGGGRVGEDGRGHFWESKIDEHSGVWKETESINSEKGKDQHTLIERRNGLVIRDTFN